MPFFSYLSLRLCFLLQMMMEIGNSRGRAVYEANIPDGFRRPQTDSYAFLHNKCYSIKMFYVYMWLFYIKLVHDRIIEK